MNALNERAVAFVNAAVACERQGDAAGALQNYADSYSIFRSILEVQGPSMKQEARDRIIAYSLDIKKKVELLRSKLKVDTAVAAPQGPNHPLVREGAAPRVYQVPEAVDDSNVDSLLGGCSPLLAPPGHRDVGPPQQSPPPTQAVPSKRSDPELGLGPQVPTTPLGKHPLPPKKDASAPQPPVAPLDEPVKPSPAIHPAPLSAPSNAKLAPRTSELVLHAINLAIRLNKERKFKQATDVLQHAFDVGRAEGNNPSNFNKIFELIIENRKRYYEVNKPRFFQDNAVSTEELDLLRKSGQTTTVILPMWDDVNEGYAAENVFLPCKAEHWEDNFTPTISPKQKAAQCILERPSKIVNDASRLQVFKSADPMNIKQTVVGDCSLVCSLIVCSSFQQRFPQFDVIGSVIFPQDPDTRKPMLSPKGKYCVKMMVNGITRMVVVDDRLPASKSAVCKAPVVTEAANGGESAPPLYHTRQLLCTYSKDPEEFWVSLLEKAFVKVCGGSYDFPGSNSSTDLFKLSGWLPDGFEFDSKETDLELQWKKLFVCHAKGAVLATVSTPSNLEKAVEEKLKLVPGHAYAILDLVEVEGRRLVKVKNPWATQSWEGLYSLNDAQWSPELLATLKFSQEEVDQGVFWMSWADLCKFFKRCNLSWNPYQLFAAGGVPRKPVRLACHGTLTYSECYAQCPQYHIEVRSLKRVSRLHLVLSRHVCDLREYLIRRNDANSEDSLVPFITVHIFDVTGSPSVAQNLKGRFRDSNLPSCENGKCLARRVVNGEELQGGMDACCIHHGVYRNVEAQTISFNCPKGDRDLVAVVSQLKGIASTSFSFSLLLHTEIPLAATAPSADFGTISMHKIPETSLEFVSRIKGAWKQGQSCGGKNGAQTFVYNPQYSLSLEGPSHVVIRLCAPSCQDALQVQLALRKPRQRKSPPIGAEEWSGRVDHLGSQNSLLVLQCPMFMPRGCVLDTALPRCLVFDATGTMKPPDPLPPAVAAAPEPPPPPPAAPKAIVSLSLKLPKIPVTISVGEVFVGTPLSLLVVVGCLSESYFASPVVSKAVFDSVEVQLGLPGGGPPLQDVVKQKEGLVVGSVILGTDEMQRNSELQKVLLSTFDVAKQCKEYYAGPIMSEVKRRCSTGETISISEESVIRRRVELDEAVMQIVLRLDSLTALPSENMKETKKALIHACNCLHAFLETTKGTLRWRCAAEGASSSSSMVLGAGLTPPANPETPLNPLPGSTGDGGKASYTIIASCWTKGVPAEFELVVETTAPHVIASIPQEGSGWKSTILQSQFRGAPGLSRHELCSDPPSASTVAVVPANSPIFSHNATATITAASRSLFSCRILTVEGPQAEASSIPIGVALFAASGGEGRRLMELVHWSNPTTHGVAVDAVELQPQRQYVLVVFSTSPSTLPFVVKCFSTADISARVN